MFAARTAMPASAKNPDLVNKIAFLHEIVLKAKIAQWILFLPAIIYG